MEVKRIETTKEYLCFIQRLYKNDKFYKDNKSDVINMICNRTGSFYKNSFQEMVKVVSGNQTKCQTILIQHKNLPDTLMLAFFESEKHAVDEVNLLVDYAKDKAKSLGCKKLLVALNGHCNYGLGILTDGFDGCPSFGEAYNFDYYKDFFEDSFKKLSFHNYRDYLPKVGEKLLKFNKRLKLKDIEFRYYDSLSKDFDEAIKIYTDLNNDIFREHYYYFKREYEEDNELFCSMKPLLLNKNLIVAFEKSLPVGFLLWYPDFNELIKPQHNLNLLSLLKYRFFNKKPKQIMLTEIGVLPKYENTGLVLSLFLKLYLYLYEKYDKNTIVCSGWIYDENLKSKNLVKHILEKNDKEF